MDVPAKQPFDPLASKSAMQAAAGGQGSASEQYQATINKVYNNNTCFWRCDEGLTKDDRLTLHGEVMAPLPLETVASTCPWSNGEAKAGARQYHKDGDTKNYAAAAKAREANRVRDRPTQPWANAHPPVWSDESKPVMMLQMMTFPE